jgi:class 3 adenylate cyclase/tetratricopeptide (TPR) repeat protein
MNTQQITSVPWSTFLPRLAPYLPAVLFNRLRELSENSGRVDDKGAQRQIARELLAATRALDPLYRVLVHYMPRYQLELDPTPGQPHGELLQGTFVFADVTGFTALTELLSKQGHTRGRETMNEIMNRLFTSVLDPLTASGGDLLVFVGDAVLAYFPWQDHDNDVFQAVRAALRMERAVAPFASFETEYGPCSLTISVGVERGPAYAGFVGTEHRMELLVSGPGTFGATEAEEMGEPGQVVLGPQALTIVKDSFTLDGSVVIDDLDEKLGGYEISLPSRRAGSSAVLGLDIDEVLQALEANLQRVERLAPFLPEDMLARLANSAGRHRQLEAEFRPVAVQFVYIVGLEDLAIKRGAEFATAVFQRYFVQVQEIVNRHEGVISQIDTYAHGFISLNTFGAPRAHEGTSLYAVSAALQLDRALEQLNREFQLDPPLKQKGGITHGLIFTGEIGATYRRESVVAGPAVNRAARLMSKAQYGQVILDADIWAETQAAFVGEKLPAVALKGIDGRVVIINVREMRLGTRLQPLERPLLGREAEQARLAEALDALQDEIPKGGKVWMIDGETGIGKTSLVSDLATMARKQGLTVLAGRCQPHGKHIPLFPWLDLLAGWLDFDGGTDPGKQRADLAAELSTLGMPDAESALADLLALPTVETSQNRKADPSSQSKPPVFAALSERVQQKQASTSQAGSLNTLLAHHLRERKPTPEANAVPQGSVWQQLAERVSGSRIIAKLLTRLAERQPLVLILEDVHWLDNESLALLNDLLAWVARLPLMVVLTGRTFVIAGDQVSALSLTPLPNTAVAGIAGRALGGRSLDDALASWIYSQTGGNPLYVEALCQALQQADAVLLDRDTGEVRWTRLTPTLPVSLHELLLARIEKLPLRQQDVLKRAAVMGVSFAYDGLMKLCQDQMNEAEVLAALEGIVQASFLTRLDDTTYRFNHSLMQETIYETLSFAQRQRWHTQVGDWLVDIPASSLELIAYHYLRGEDMAKAADFGCRAGDKARQQGVYGGALEYYDQVLGLPEASPEILLCPTESRADVLALQGDYAAAIAAYAQAIELGSTSALGKQVLLSGNPDQLAQVDFPPDLRPWAAGARAWQLARAGQVETALEVIQQALTEGLACAALETLAQTLSANQTVGEYEEWLGQFVNVVLAEA